MYAATLAAAARSADAGRDLAVALMAAAVEEPTPANRYALLDLARATAAAAGDLPTATAAADALAAHFVVDPDPLKATAAVATLRVPGASVGDRRMAVLRAASLAGQLASAGRGELVPLVDVAVSAAAGDLRDPALTAQARASAAAHSATSAAVAAVARQRDQLRTKPADPAANEAVGRHECFVDDDWAAGLPHLAAGADPALRSAAASDLAGGDTVDARIARGDAWVAAARVAPVAGPRAKLLARARHWYALAAADAVGLSRAQVDARPEAGGRPRRLAGRGPADPARGGQPAGERRPRPGRVQRPVAVGRPGPGQRQEPGHQAPVPVPPAGGI